MSDEEFETTVRLESQYGLDFIRKKIDEAQAYVDDLMAWYENLDPTDFGYEYDDDYRDGDAIAAELAGYKEWVEKLLGVNKSGTQEEGT